MKGYRRALWLAALMLAVSMALFTGSTEADPTAIPTMTVPPEPVRLRSVRIRAAGDLMMHKKQLAIAKQKDGSYDTFFHKLPLCKAFSEFALNSDGVKPVIFLKSLVK